MKRFLFFLFLIMASLFWLSCEKRRVRNKLEGTWVVKSYVRDTANMLVRYDSVPVFSAACDTTKVQFRRQYEISFDFRRDGTVSRNMKALHRFSNASLLDASCRPSFNTAEYDSLLQGKWEYAEGGNLALQFPSLLDNITMKFNGDREMSWQQVLQIDTGFVKFSGVENLMLQKQN
jgi:hypothetical protein